MVTYLKSRTTGKVQSSTGRFNEYVIDQEQVMDGDVVIVEERGHYEPYDDGVLYEIDRVEYDAYIAALPPYVPVKSKVSKLVEYAELQGWI